MEPIGLHKLSPTVNADRFGPLNFVYYITEIKIPHQGSSLSSVVADAHIADLGAKVRRHSPNPVTEIEFSGA